MTTKNGYDEGFKIERIDYSKHPKTNLFIEKYLGFDLSKREPEEFVTAREEIRQFMIDHYPVNELKEALETSKKNYKDNPSILEIIDNAYKEVNLLQQKVDQNVPLNRYVKDVENHGLSIENLVIGLSKNRHFEADLPKNIVNLYKGKKDNTELSDNPSVDFLANTFSDLKNKSARIGM